MCYNTFRMRTAYALLGLTFLIVFGLAYLIFERVYAPADAEFVDRTE